MSNYREIKETDGEIQKRFKDPKMHHGYWTIDGMNLYNILEVVSEVKKDFKEMLKFYDSTGYCPPKVYQLVEKWFGK